MSDTIYTKDAGEWGGEWASSTSQNICVRRFRKESW